MKISPINNTNYNTGFSAKIAPNPEWDNYLRYIKENAVQRPGYWNSTPNKNLIDMFIKAVEANPSDALLNIDIAYNIKEETFNARGIISSQYGKFKDTEPARSDSNAPFENIIRRILNPENRFQMYKLFGADYNIEKVKAQNEWWDEYIFPIWNGIQEVFFERTVYPKSYDSLWNKEFREQNPV